MGNSFSFSALQRVFGLDSETKIVYVGEEDGVYYQEKE
jgi:hypothetical protein